MRVAAAPATSVPGDVDANVATARSLVDSAAERDVRVLVLPELFLTGYDLGEQDPALVVADLAAAEVDRAQETNAIDRDRLPSLGHRTRLMLRAP